MNTKRYALLSFTIFLMMASYAQGDQNPFLRQGKHDRLLLTEEGASHFSSLAMSCLQKEYPNKLNQVLGNRYDLQDPKTLHPAFYGCFDWHSSVHGHWMLIRLLKSFPDLPEATEIREKLNKNLTASNLAGEVAYFETAGKSWERMYGWSWLLKLAKELHDWDDPDGKRWKTYLQPLADVIVERYLEFLPIQQYPVRTGVHPNTAFGLSFALDYAVISENNVLQTIIKKRARDYYMADTNCPADWEPSGEDFLSACLEEANLMRRVLSEAEFARWFKKFLPKKKLRALNLPADVSDRSDPKIVHLDGLNLSRAWCMYGIAPFLKKKIQKQLLEAAARHLNATVPNVASEHYEGSHWLASFVVYALSVNE